MQVHELIYKAAGLPVPKENPFEWSTLVAELDHTPAKYTIQVLGLNEVGFNKIYLFVAHYNAKKDEVLIDYSGDKILSLSNGETITVNFKVLKIRELVGELLTDDGTRGMMLIQQLAEIECVTGSTVCEVYEKLVASHPELTNVDMFNITKNHLPMSNLTMTYLTTLISQQLNLTTCGTFNNSLRLNTVWSGMAELSTYLADDSVCTHIIDTKNILTTGIKLPDFNEGEYLINNLGFKVYFKGSVKTGSLDDNDLQQLTDLVISVLGDADIISQESDSVKLTYGNKEISVAKLSEPRTEKYVMYTYTDAVIEQFIEVLECHFANLDELDIISIYAVTVNDREACGLTVNFHGSEYQMVIG